MNSALYASCLPADVPDDQRDLVLSFVCPCERTYDERERVADFYDEGIDILIRYDSIIGNGLGSDVIRSASEDLAPLGRSIAALFRSGCTGCDRFERGCLVRVRQDFDYVLVHLMCGTYGHGGRCEEVDAFLGEFRSWIGRARVHFTVVPRVLRGPAFEL